MAAPLLLESLLLERFLRRSILLRCGRERTRSPRHDPRAVAARAARPRRPTAGRARPPLPGRTARRLAPVGRTRRVRVAGGGVCSAGRAWAGGGAGRAV